VRGAAVEHVGIQHEKGEFTMRPRTLLIFVLAVLAGAAVVVLPALAAAPSEAKLEVNENCVEANWPCWTTAGSGPKPNPASRVTIAAGGEVKFTDKVTTATNIAWTGTAPVCSSGVPVSPTPAKTGWEGTCKFEESGTYRFESSTLFNDGALDYTKYEVVVEGASTATSPTTTTETRTPLEGGARALTLKGAQRGTTVHGSVKVSPLGSGGRLEVGLFTSAAGHPRIGRLVRGSVKAGNVSFQVPLDAKGRAMLHRHRHLTLTVKAMLTPPHGAAVTVARVVVLRP
jgi:hypothetical protein